MSEDEFWDCTPRQFAARMDEYLEGEKRADYRAGVIAAILANAHRDPKKGKKSGYKPGDFFPSLARK